MYLTLPKPTLRGSWTGQALWFGKYHLGYTAHSQIIIKFCVILILIFWKLFIIIFFRRSTEIWWNNTIHILRSFRKREERWTYWWWRPAIKVLLFDRLCKVVFVLLSSCFYSESWEVIVKCHAWLQNVKNPMRMKLFKFLTFPSGHSWWAGYECRWVNTE